MADWPPTKSRLVQLLQSTENHAYSASDADLSAPPDARAAFTAAMDKGRETAIELTDENIDFLTKDLIEALESLTPR